MYLRLKYAIVISIKYYKYSNTRLCDIKMQVSCFSKKNKNIFIDLKTDLDDCWIDDQLHTDVSSSLSHVDTCLSVVIISDVIKKKRKKVAESN